MKKFLYRTLFFSFPIIALLALPTFILWNSEENFHEIENTFSDKGKYLIGYAYNENNYGYVKWSNINAKEKKTVWALGSSRVLQFRSNMFDKSFYNAGYTIVGINDFMPFLKSFPKEKHPEYLIIGLDHWMFNANWDKLEEIPAENSWQESFTLKPGLSVYEKVYKDYFAGKYNTVFPEDNSIHKIGINAVKNNTGFRNDGSMFYGGQIAKLIEKNPKALDYNYSDTFKRIKKGKSRFEFGSEVNEKALVALKKLLEYCRQQNIKVVGFLPPFADKVYDRMDQTGKHDYIKKIYGSIKPIFENSGYSVYDYSKVSLCNSNDNETIDGFHGGEATYQKLLIDMLRRGSVLNEVTTAKRLETDLLKKQNNYIIYGY